MAVTTADNVEETTLGGGSGPSFTLSGAVLGKQSFATAFAVGTAQILVLFQESVGPNWMTCFGTLTDARTFRVDSVYASSNNGGIPNFGQGRVHILTTVPAALLLPLLNGGSIPSSLAVAGAAGAGTVGSAYSATFTASGGVGSYTYTLGTGSFPAGLTINPSTGVLSGTPTTAGTANFTVHAVDSTPGTPLVGDSASQSVTIAASGGGTADTKPRYTTGTASASLATLFAAAADVPSATNGSRVAGPFTVSPAASNYGYVFILQSACATGGGIPGGSYGATFTDSIGAGGWQGAGLSGNNSGASPSQSYSNVTYTDTTGVYVVFRQDYANSAFTGSTS